MPWAALGGAAGGGGEDGPGKVGQRAIVLEMLTTICQLFDNYLTTIWQLFENILQLFHNFLDKRLM